MFDVLQDLLKIQTSGRASKQTFCMSGGTSKLFIEVKYGHGHWGLEIRNTCCKIIYDFEIPGHFICAKMIYMLYNI